VRPRPTRRGLAALAAAPPLLAAGLLLGHPVLSGLGGFALGAVLVGLVPALVRVRPAVHRTVHPARLERGEHASAVLVVRNEGTQRQPAFVAGDRAGPAVTEVAVPALPPGGSSVHRYDVPTDRRGRLEIGPLTVQRSDLLGLVHSRAAIGAVLPLWVLPRLRPVRVAGGGRLRHHDAGRVPDRPLRGSTDLRSVREYVPGDELRHVHWRASARAGQLLVREYVDPVQPHCTVVLDVRGGAGAALDATAFEEAVEVAASVLWAAAGAGHRVALHAGEQVAAPAGADGGRALLDRLAAVAQQPGQDLARTLEVLRRGPRGGWLVVVTGAADPAVLGAVAGLRGGFGPVTVFDVSDWPGRVDAPGVVVVRGATAEAALAAWNGRAA
jgi:uncharacterized protein (DUF58 family)